MTHDELFNKFIAGIKCKACGKELTENPDSHWYFQCNPNYVPKPIQFPVVIRKPKE